jgi:hypothetical protein
MKPTDWLPDAPMRPRSTAEKCRGMAYFASPRPPYRAERATAIRSKFFVLVRTWPLRTVITETWHAFSVPAAAFA